MYCSRITVVSPEAVHLLRRDMYQPHKAVWSFFADRPDRKRDFLFRQDAVRGGMIYYVVSERPPLDDLPGWHVETKPYAPVLRTGELLQFSLRVNPVRKVRDADKRQHRHDVVMDAKRRAREAGEHPGSAGLERRAGLSWLQERCLDWGVSVHADQTRVHSYRKHEFFKKSSGNNKVSFCSLDFDGLLTVNDPQALLRTLRTGVGCCKGFGCGLLLVRRA